MNALTRICSGSPVFTVISNGDPIQEKLFSFLNLQNGWHYGRGRAPSHTAVLFAASLAKELESLGARKIEVFPGIDGTILVSAFGQGKCVDVTVSDADDFNYVVEEGDVEIAALEHVSFSQLLQTIHEEGWLSCDSLDLCTPNTIVRSYKDLNRWRSKIQTAPVYQWSTNPVWRIPA